MDSLPDVASDDVWFRPNTGPTPAVSKTVAFDPEQKWLIYGTWTDRRRKDNTTRTVWIKQDDIPQEKLKQAVEYAGEHMDESEKWYTEKNPFKTRHHRAKAGRPPH